MGEIDEVRLAAELATLKQELAQVERPAADLEEAVHCLGDVGRLWAESPPEFQRRFVSEVFTSLEVRERELVTIALGETYAPLFLADRRVRFGGVAERVEQPCPFTTV